MSADRSAVVTLPDGTESTAWRRSAWQVRAGDFLPDYGRAAMLDSAYDDDDRRHYIALEDGEVIELTRRAKVWIVRDYAGTSWLSAASAAYREATSAREAMRESDALAPSSVPGIAGAAVSMYQLEADEFDAHVPAPSWRDYVREYAPRPDMAGAI